MSKLIRVLYSIPHFWIIVTAVLLIGLALHVGAHHKMTSYRQQAEEILNDEGRPTGQVLYTHGKSSDVALRACDYVDHSDQGTIHYVEIGPKNDEVLVTVHFDDGTVKSCTSGGVKTVSGESFSAQLDHYTNDHEPTFDYLKLTIWGPEETVKRIRADIQQAKAALRTNVPAVPSSVEIYEACTH